jgi:hypothetical protein
LSLPDLTLARAFCTPRDVPINSLSCVIADYAAENADTKGSQIIYK